MLYLGEKNLTKLQNTFDESVYEEKSALDFFRDLISRLPQNFFNGTTIPSSANLYYSQEWTYWTSTIRFSIINSFSFRVKNLYYLELECGYKDT